MISKDQFSLFEHKSIIIKPSYFKVLLKTLLMSLMLSYLYYEIIIKDNRGYNDGYLIALYLMVALLFIFFVDDLLNTNKTSRIFLSKEYVYIEQRANHFRIEKSSLLRIEIETDNIPTIGKYKVGDKSRGIRFVTSEGVHNAEILDFNLLNIEFDMLLSILNFYHPHVIVNQKS